VRLFHGLTIIITPTLTPSLNLTLTGGVLSARAGKEMFEKMGKGAPVAGWAVKNDQPSQLYWSPYVGTWIIPHKVGTLSDSFSF